MGIREEIEKLRMPPYRETAGVLYYRDEDRNYNYVIDAVLSVLDEHLGELVTEIPVDEEMEIELVWDTKIGEMIPVIFRLGDHISIYRRRKK